MQNNLFLAPASRSGDAYDHFTKSILKGIPRERLEQSNCTTQQGVVRIWGLTSGLEKSWKQAEPGDWVLFYTGDGKYEYAAQISGKTHDSKLGNEIRSRFLEVSDKEKREGKTWEFLLCLTSPVKINLSGDTLSDWLGYKQNYQSRFQRVTQERLVDIDEKFGSLDALVEEFRE